MKNGQILGIGIDIEDIGRFKKIELSKKSAFLNKIFTATELDYCFSKKNIASNLATKFAGKEAVIKACNFLDKTNLDYHEIEITNDPSGAPKVKLIRDEVKKYQIMISLSNELDKTVGVAIVTGNN